MLPLRSARRTLRRVFLSCLFILVPLATIGCGAGGGGGTTAATTPGATTPGSSTPVQVESLLVTAGPTGGGTKIEIIGKGFFGALRVMVGGREATEVKASTDGTRITAMTPAAAQDITVADVVVISDTNGQAQAPIPFQYQPTPTLSTVSPARGAITGGIPVTISGTNFLGTVGVTFGGKSATGVAASPDGTRVVCTAPSYTAEASVDVVVQSSISGAVTAAAGFTYFNPTPAFPPTVNAIAPNRGAMTGGTQLTITGQNFRGLVGVTVDGSSCINVVVNTAGTLLTCNTPTAASSGAKNVVVTNGDGTSATVAGGFTYDPPLSITSVSPSSGPSSGGTLLTIDGAQFTGNLTVRVGGQPAASVTVNGPRTRITCITPSVSQGATVDVDVLSDTNGSASRASAFTYVDPPLIVTNLSPAAGPLAGNTLLTINGTAFIPPITVVVGGLVATSVSVDGSQRRLTCRTPATSTAGLVNVVVSSPVNGAGTLINAFQYNPLPTLSAVTPNNGPLAGNVPITITGGACGGGGGVPLAGLVGGSLSLTAQGDVVTATTPAAQTAPGAKTLTVTASESGQVSSTYRYNSLPSISSLAPPNGPMEGGTGVIITGGSFEGTVNVTIAGLPAQVTSVNGAKTQVAVITPANDFLGTADVQVSASLAGLAEAFDAFTYDPNPLPTVATVVPNVGPQDGGTPIVITGTNFRGSVTVTIDGQFCSGVTVNTSGTRIDCTTPASLSLDGGKTLEVISDTHGPIAVPDGFTYNPLPTITGVTPVSGPQSGGNPIVIDGTGFGGTVTVSIGQFAASSVTVNASQTQITCQSPGATAEGDVDVLVTSSTHGSQIRSPGYHFNPLPSVIQVTPSSGPLVGGTPLVIDGDDFGGTVNVTIDGRACTGVLVNGGLNQITCVTPASATGPGAKRLDIGSTVNGPVSLLGGFTYNPTPTITAITPNNGPEQGGTAVAIDGSGFTGTLNVTFGAVAAQNVQVFGGGTRITCDTPPSGSGGGARNVIVASDQTGTVTATNGFTYNPSPTITSVSPATGSVAGGTAVVILGTNFQGALSVNFGLVPARNVTVSAGFTRIDCVTDPSTVPGLVDVTVISSSNGTQVRTNGFTYVPPGPFFPSIVPNEGPRNTQTPVVLTGFNMLGLVTVTFGGTAATGVTANASGTVVNCLTPATFVTGAVDVVLTSPTNGTTTSASGFRFNPPPLITGVVPPSGPLAGGNTVVLSGSDFRGAITVSVGGVNATGVTGNVTADQVTFTMPAGAAVAAATVNVTCTASGTTSSTYTYNPTPTIVSVAPGDGPQTGGTPLTIAGTNFLGSVTVTIDGAAATGVNVTAGTTITCVAPAATSGPGAKSVVVTSSTHGSTTRTGGYTYNPFPSINTITPNNGPLAGTNNVTLDGSNFLGTVNVTIDNQPAPTVSVSSTRVVVTAPSSTSVGGKNVILSSSRAGSATVIAGYTYNPTPTLSAVVPSAGSQQGNTLVVISGAFFGGTVQVFFGGVPATSVAVNGSKTQVTCRTPSSVVPGLVDVTVTASANGSVTRTLGYDYQPPPTVTSVTPNNGPQAGGTIIAIDGTNFGGNCTVDIGGAPCTGVSVNATRTRITATTGPSVSGSCSGGIPCKTVTVSSALNGVGTLTNAFAYNAPPIALPPVVPNNGPLEGGTLITITGSRFDGNISVAIAGQSCTGVIVNNPTNTIITCRTPRSISGVGSRNVVIFSDRNGPVTIVNGFRYNEQLTVTSIVPNEGPVAGGTTINITGTFFDPTLDPVGGTGFFVTIDGSPCTSVTVNASRTLITCITPPSPQLPPDDVGPKTVVVHSDRNGTATVPNGFTYRPLPTFLGIDPNNGPLAGGTNVDISGTDFRGFVDVKIDGALCTGVSVNTSFTNINCFTPPSSSGIGPKDVVVLTTGAGNVTQTAGFTYNPTPTVISITPDQGPVAGGNVITIDGTGFRDTVNVSIGGVLATNVTPNVTGTSMTLTVPASASGDGPATLEINSTRDGISIFPGAYTYRNPPTFTAINPNNGPLAGGQAVAITGTNFFGNVGVTIDGAACTNVTVTALGDRIDCDTPASPSGVGAKNVAVTASAAGTVNATASYTYNQAPTILTVTPDNGPLGGATRIIITGTDFQNTVSVDIAGNPCTIISVNASRTQIDCDTPASTSGVGAKALTVTSSSHGAVSRVPGFTYNATPTITSLNPPEGPLVGGNTLFINGTDFRGTPTVTIDGQACTGVTASTTFSFIRCTVPASTTGTGAKNVVVTASLAGTVTGVGAYIYNPLPTFTGISPDNGPQGGGTAVTITGTDFRGAVSVRINNVACTNVSVGSTFDTITCRTPASPNGTGLRDVLVDCTLSGTVTQVNAFRYNPSPTVISIVPSNGPQGGGTPIAITGTEFRGSVTVTIDGAPCAGVTVSNTFTRIDCVTPPSVTGPGSKDVVITASLSGSLTVLNGYVYNITPGVLTINPNEGPNQGGQVVLITGTDFVGSIGVQFGPNSGTVNVVSPDSTRITATTPPFNGTGLVDVGILSSTNGNVTITNAYTYNAPPTFLTITPDEGPETGGTPVVILGTLFRGVVQVFIDGAPCTNVTVNTTFTRIDAVTPASSSGPGLKSVQVVSSLNGQITVNNAFRYNPGPTIINVVDNNGPAAGGQPITINGTGFGGTLNVTIDGASCTNVLGNGARDRITCVTPAARSGVGAKTLSVQSSSNGIINLLNGFTYNATPTLTDVNPNEGPAAGGQLVILTGTGFNPTLNVSFGAVPAQVVSVNATNTQATVVTPPLPPGGTPGAAVSITVNSTFTGAATVLGAYTYNITPTVTAINPNTGPLGGGQLVTIDGTRFRGQVAVRFGGAPAANVLVNGGQTQITCRTPPGQAPIPVDVQVDSSLNGLITVPLGYTYNNTPTVSNMQPAEGPAVGGTRVIISGAGFLPPVFVSFGAGFGNSVSVNPTFTQVQVNSPPLGFFPAVPTTVPVTVSSFFTGDLGVAGGFTYNPLPTLASLNPQTGPAQGGQQSVLIGNFLGPTAGATVSVIIGGNVTTNVTFTNDALGPGFDRVIFTTPPGAIGPADLTLVSSTHGIVTFPGRYTYNGAPVLAVVSPITPNEGPMDGRTTVLIVGTGFDPTINVTVGTLPATNVTTTSNTTISARVPAVTSAGARTVLVESTTNGTVTGTFTYNATPSITTIAPNNGPVAGGQEITISNNNTSFRGVMTVTFGATVVPTQNVTVAVGNASMVVRTPAGAGTGPVNLTIDSSVHGTTVVSNGFTYNGAPTILSVSPNVGPVNATTSITVTGTGFLPDAVVRINGFLALPTTFVTSTTILATAPTSQRVGAVDVVVDSALGGLATLTGGFTYSPVFTQAAPLSTPAAGAPSTVAHGDFNGDGTQDLVVSNQFANSVSVFVSGTRTDFPVNGTEPANVAVADMNCDGRPDIITTNKISGDLTVFINAMALPTNTPTFNAVVPALSMPGTPGALIVRDINGDGLPDVVAVAESGGQVLVRTNTTVPGGALNLSTFTSTGAAGLSSPTGLAMADFTHDGFPDLVVCEAAPGVDRVRLFQNISPVGGPSGNFSAVTTLNVGRQPQAVATGDLNGDGRPDLVVANRQDDTFSTFLASGTIGTFTFTAQTVRATGDGPVAIAIADMDGSNVPDVITANDASSNVSVRLNQTVPGAGTVAFAAQSDTPCNQTPGSLLILDVNNDGKRDMILPNRTQDRVTQLINATPMDQNFPATVAANPDFALTTGDDPQAVVAADFNLDGKLDLVIANRGASNLSILRNTTTTNNATVTWTRTTRATNAQPIAVAVGDLNYDGKPDLVVLTNTDTCQVFFNSTTGPTAQPTFNDATPAALVAAGEQPRGVAIGDFNRDGKNDIAISLLSALPGLSPRVRVAANTTVAGTSPWTGAAVFDVAGVSSGPTTLAVGDLNGDGCPDLVTANVGSSSVQAIVNGIGIDGPSVNVTFTAASPRAVGAGPLAVRVSDISGDGRLDIVSSDNAGSISLVRNSTANPGLAPTFDSPVTTAGINGPTSLDVGELSGDGRPDVVTSNGGDNTTSVFLNLGGALPGGASRLSTFPAAVNPQGAAIGDFNNDYRPDIGVINFGPDSLTVLRNTTIP